MDGGPPITNERVQCLNYVKALSGKANKEKMLINYPTVGRNKAEKAGRERPSDICYYLTPQKMLGTWAWVGRQRESWRRHV